MCAFVEVLVQHGEGVLAGAVAALLDEALQGSPQAVADDCLLVLDGLDDLALLLLLSSTL